MENNEKNKQNKAANSMEDLISSLFLGLAEDTEKEKKEETTLPHNGGEPCDADGESDAGATPEQEESAKAVTYISESDNVEDQSVNCLNEARELSNDIPPEITEADSSVTAGAIEIEKIRNKKSGKNEVPEEDLTNDDWTFIRTPLGKKHFGTDFWGFAAFYALLLTVLCGVFIIGVNQLVKIYDESDPNRVVDGQMEYLSGTKLYNDIVQLVKGNHTEFETELSAAQSVMNNFSVDAEKNYFVVSETDKSLLYDVFSGNTKLYSLSLAKKSEVELLAFKINFWEINNIVFNQSCVSSLTKTFTVSAPAKAEVKINGVTVSPSYVTDENYKFFIGSAFETEIPETARCVLYTVDGLYGAPVVTATLDGEDLDIYADGDGTCFHAKYPKKWVRNYTISVPSGAAVHVNGVLATKIDSHGTGHDTLFDSGENAKTDIYVIEGLFEVPTVTATFGTVSLGEPTVDGQSFSFGYIKEMYLTAEITVPKGAQIKVNGVLLSDENSTCKAVPFSEWAAYSIELRNYMPAELRATTGVKMPEFVCYTVNALYTEPSIEVTLNGAECKEFSKSSGDRICTRMFDFPAGVIEASVSSFAENFAKVYVKYCTEGCYGINDDIELRKNLYQNWTNYLSYIVPDSLCYDNALESYTDIRYRPIRKVVSENYNVQNIIKYSEDVYICRIICTVTRTGDEQPVISFVNAMVVRINGEFKIWSHDTIPA